MDAREESDLKRARQNGLTLKFAKEQTREIVLAAISQNPSCFVDVKIQTQENTLLAVSKNGFMLNSVKEQTPEIALAAVTQNGYAIRYVKTRSDALSLAAWKNKGDNILNLMSECDWADSLEILLKNKPNLENTSSQYQETPFQIATRMGHINTMQILHQHGANVQVKNKHNDSNVLLDFVRHIKNISLEDAIPVIKTLLSLGVDPDEPNKIGKTAVMYADNNSELNTLFNAYRIKMLVEKTISKTQSILPAIKKTIRF